MKKLLVLSLFIFYFSFSHAQIITTIVGNGYDAGTGSGTYSGDGGQATDAELYFPEGVVFNKAGDMYFSEGNRVEKVSM